MLRPLIVAKILQLLEINSNCNILEIGTGSGYLTCCLSMIGKTVDTVDIDKSMLDAAASSIDLSISTVSTVLPIIERQQVR